MIYFDLSVQVKNTQQLFKINPSHVRRQVGAIQKVLGIQDTYVDVWFCSDGKMRQLNLEWRNKRTSTDILSFPVNEVSVEIKDITTVFFLAYIQTATLFTSFL